METFSRNAADLIRLRAWLYGWDDAKVLMMRCYRRSRAERVNEATVLRVWIELDEAMTEGGVWEERAALLEGV